MSARVTKCSQDIELRSALSSSSDSPTVKKAYLGHPLNGGGHVLHVGVDDPVWVHVGHGQLHGHSDLVLQALGPSLADRELGGQGVIWGR